MATENWNGKYPSCDWEEMRENMEAWGFISDWEREDQERQEREAEEQFARMRKAAREAAVKSYLRMKSLG